MKTETFLRKLSVVLTAAILVVGVTACASHKATAGTDYGQVRTEASSSQSTSSDQVVGTAPAPANAQNVEGSTTTPAVISGPAKVDNRPFLARAVVTIMNSTASRTWLTGALTKTKSCGSRSSNDTRTATPRKSNSSSGRLSPSA